MSRVCQSDASRDLSRCIQKDKVLFIEQNSEKVVFSESKMVDKQPQEMMGFANTDGQQNKYSNGQSITLGEL